jgi:hypothetical protein
MGNLSSSVVEGAAPGKMQTRKAARMSSREGPRFGAISILYAIFFDKARKLLICVERNGGASS